MKKSIFLSLLMGAASLTGFAQTDFRHITFDEALNAARQEKKMLFIDFYTDWCGPCKKMANEVFPQQSVGAYMNKNFVNLKLNAEKEGADLAKKYGVAAYPTFIVVDADGNFMTKVTGYRQGDEFISKLQAALDPDQAPGKIKQRFEAGDRSPKVVDGYVMSLMESKKEEEGLKIIDDYFSSLTDAQRLAPENNFIFTRYTLGFDNQRARFMVDNHDKFDKAVREDVKNHLSKLYNSEIAYYFSGYMYREGKFNADTYANLKKEINNLGFNKDNSYNILFDFVEKRVNSNDADFLAYCDSRYSELGSREKTIMIMNFTRLIQDTALYGEMSKFLRNRLTSMSPIEIQFAGRILGTLEQ